MQEFENIQKFINYAEKFIRISKERGKTNFGILDTKFESDAVAQNAKTYFESKGFSVEIRKCKSCKTHDFIISW